MKHSVNINDLVKVKLTEFGQQIVNMHYGQTHESVYDDGCHRFQLWQLMHIFGNALFLGSQPIFERGEIVFI